MFTIISLKSSLFRQIEIRLLMENNHIYAAFTVVILINTFIIFKSSIFLETKLSHSNEEYNLRKIQEAEAKAREAAVQVAMEKAQSRVEEIEREKVSSAPAETVKLRKEPVITRTLTDPVTYDSINISDQSEKSENMQDTLVDNERERAEKLLQERMRAYMNQQNKRFV